MLTVNSGGGEGCFVPEGLAHVLGYLLVHPKLPFQFLRAEDRLRGDDPPPEQIVLQQLLPFPER